VKVFARIGAGDDGMGGGDIRFFLSFRIAKTNPMNGYYTISFKNSYPRAHEY